MSAERLSDLMNLGPAAQERLPEVGIHTPEDLERVGAVEAYQRLKERFPKQTSRNVLYAMVGALLDVRWNELPPDVLDRARVAADGLDR